MLLYTVVLFAWVLIKDTTADSAVQYRAFHQQVVGEIWVLDVGSLVYQSPPPPGQYLPVIRTEENCRDHCKLLPQCNAWSYCARPEGCGSGCRRHRNKNPTMFRCPPSQPTCDPHSISATSTPLPILGFGPFAKDYRGADCDRVNPDLWPWGTCTLKRVNNTESPDLETSIEDSGWVSGTLELPPSCSSISAAACERCHLPAITDPKACIECAKDHSTRVELLQGLLDYEKMAPMNNGTKESMYVQLSAPEGCSSCYLIRDQALRETCLDCLRRVLPCASCALAPTLFDYFSNRQDLQRNRTAEWSNPEAIHTCFTCVKKFGDPMYGPCTGCAAVAAMKEQQDLKNCMGCLDNMVPYYCGRSTEKGKGSSARRECITSPQQQNLCFQCAVSGLYDQCLGCAMKQPFYDECFSCGYLESQEERKMCFDCVDKVPDSYRERMQSMGGGLACQSCLQSPSYLASGCQQCLMNSTASTFEYCNDCHQKYYDDEAIEGAAGLRTQCYSCVLSGDSDPSTCIG